MATVGKLQEEAEKRKERLRSLREKQREAANGQKENTEKLPKPIFRSYQPQDETLKDNQLPKTKPTEVKDIVQEQLDAAKPEPLVEEVDLVNLAPRKPDWDLKRDIAKKLERLERRTQRAIAELIRERLAEGREDLATAVAANMAANQPDDDDDD